MNGHQKNESHGHRKAEHLWANRVRFQVTLWLWGGINAYFRVSRSLIRGIHWSVVCRLLARPVREQGRHGLPRREDGQLGALQRKSSHYRRVPETPGECLNIMLAFWCLNDLLLIFEASWSLLLEFLNATHSESANWYNGFNQEDHFRKLPILKKPTPTQFYAHDLSWLKFRCP